ncbi:Uncharacterised protein [Chlamydia trachomatis]|nr:Uncharacterised protein [Chlamydia trachomatis]
MGHSPKSDIQERSGVTGSTLTATNLFTHRGLDYVSREPNVKLTVARQLNNNPSNLERWRLSEKTRPKHSRTAIRPKNALHEAGRP